MKTYVIRASVNVDEQVGDRDTWAVDLVEGSRLGEDLKAGWFWSTWPDRVEFVFSVRANEDSARRYSREIGLLLAKAPGVEGQPKLSIEERAGSQSDG